MSHLWYKSLLLVVMVGLGLLLTNRAACIIVAAQGVERWSPAERIPNYEQSTWTPLLVADQNRTVHVFASMLLEEIGIRAIVYRQWRLDQGWTAVNDILLPPIKKEASLHGVLLDQAGFIHLAFFSGDENEASIYYTQAPAQLANQASAWTSPAQVGPAAFTFDDAVLASNSQGDLFILYAGTQEGYGIYETHSVDGGQTWTEASPMFLTYDAEQMPFDLNVYVAVDDTIHLVWAVNDLTGNTEAIYYAQLPPRQQSWTAATEIEAVGGIPAGQPAMISYAGELQLVYHAPTPEGLISRYLRRSSDNGETWSEKTRLFPQIGSNGPVAFVVDGGNTLHMFFGNRVENDQQITYGMWHSIWRGGQWLPPTAVVSGAYRIEFDPAFAHAVVSQGNVILVTWMADPVAIAQRKGGAWFSYITLDSPEQPVVALSLPVPTSPPPKSELGSLTRALTPTRLEQATMRQQAIKVDVATNANEPRTLLTITLTPVLLLTALVVWQAMRKQPR